MKVRCFLVLLASLVTLSAPAMARADTVTDWNAHASNSLHTVAAQAPTVGSLHMAMVHGAMYDAVNAIDGRYEPYLYPGRRGAFWASKDAAAATAAYRVLSSIVPSQQAQLEQLYNASLAKVPTTSSKWIGVSIGSRAAAAMIDARTGDGRFGAPGFPTGTLPGQWRPVLPGFVNDPAGWMRNVKPFLLQSPSQFRSAGPFPLTSAAYATEFDQVKSVGSLNSTTRTMFQTNASLYWAENGARTWFRIFRTVSAQEGLTLEENARLFAMFGTALADALINVWDDKAFYGFWRPITAIREAHLDGNPATTADPAWLPLIVNPPYPEHSSGASAVAGAAARTLQNFLGTDDVAWADTNLGGQTRSFTRASDAMKEVVDARVWSGIHFLRADEHGAQIGRQVADWANEKFFRPAS
jgi:hypothetical protein